MNSTTLAVPEPSFIEDGSVVEGRDPKLPPHNIIVSLFPVTIVTRNLDVISIRSPQQPLCWWGAACNLIPSQMQARYDIRGFHAVWRKQVEQFTILRLVPDRPLTLSAAAVSKALHTTELRHDDLLVQRS